MDITIYSIPAIITVVYTVIEAMKLIHIFNEKTTKLIPVLACLLGSIISGACYLAQPELLPVSNFMGAVIAGAASGLSAVGVNQIGKQLGGDDNDNKR